VVSVRAGNSVLASTQFVVSSCRFVRRQYSQDTPISSTPGNSFVNLILGLDVLHKHNFTIDYEHRKIIFESASPPAQSVPFVPDATLAVVYARVFGKTIRILMDTGAERHCVFQEGPIRWMLNRVGPPTSIQRMGNSSTCREVLLYTFKIGNIEWWEPRRWL